MDVQFVTESDTAEDPPTTEPSRSRSRESCFSWRPAPALQCLFVGILLLALLPVLTLRVASLYGEYRERRADALRLEVTAARRAAELLQVHITEAQEDGATLAQPFLQAPALPRWQWNSLLARFIVEHRTLRSLTWVDGRGQVLATSDPERVGQHPDRLPWPGANRTPTAGR